LNGVSSPFPGHLFSALSFLRYSFGFCRLLSCDQVGEIRDGALHGREDQERWQHHHYRVTNESRDLFEKN
jgi:hypothetical protein